MFDAKGSNKPLAEVGRQIENAVAISAQDVRALVEEILSRHNASPRDEIIGFDQLVARLPLGARSLRAAVKAGRVPAIRLKGGRKLLFRWSSVVEALSRLEGTTE
jgi:hypothetical protein